MRALPAAAPPRKGRKSNAGDDVFTPACNAGVNGFNKYSRPVLGTG